MGFGAGRVGLGGGGAAQGAVRSGVVAEPGEPVQELPEPGDGGGQGLGGQPAFEGLPEPFDLALGLRVVGLAVLLGDAQGVTDNGSCYRAAAFADALGDSRHQRITPYTPRRNGKIERYNRILTEEFLYARTWHSEQARAAAFKVWNWHYNYHRPDGAQDGQPPASATPSRVNNVQASYS